jgi:hypothetical protein
MAPYRDTDLSALNTAHLFPYVPSQTTQPISSAHTPPSATSDTVPFDFAHVGTEPHSQQGPSSAGVSPFQFEPRAPVHGLAPLAGQSAVHCDHVLYYFEHVRKMQYPFAGNSVTNVTYSVSLKQSSTRVV